MNVQSELEKCLMILLSHDMNQYQILCSLVNAYNDLNLSDKAYEILTSEIKLVRRKSTQDKSFKHVLVTAVNMNIQQHLYENVEKIVQELEIIFDELSNHDVSDQLLHMHVLITAAQIYQYNSNFFELLKR